MGYPQGALNLPGLFEDDFKSNIDAEEIINIDLDHINQEALDSASTSLKDIVAMYSDESFMKAHPAFKSQLDSEINTMRRLYKMLQTDEETHDILIRNIGSNAGNASLYRSLSDLQKTMLSISSQIDDKKESIARMLKNYQLEVNASQMEEDVNDAVENSQDKTTFRGSKDFIRSMQEEDDVDE